MEIMDNLSKEAVEILKNTSIMNVKFNIYSYVTPDNKPGTLIVHPDLSKPFDEQRLFDMDEVELKEVSLLDILEKGFIKIGSTDIMEDMDIEYPLILNKTYEKNKIIGKHWSYTPTQVAQMIGKEFEIENIDSFYSDNDFDSLDSDSSDFDNANSIREFDNANSIREKDKLSDIDSVLHDGKMDEIFSKIDTCEQTAIKDVDRLLSELA